MHLKTTMRTLGQLRARFGLPSLLQHLVFRMANRIFYLDCLQIIALDREDLRPLDPNKTRGLSSRVATAEDLKEMQRQGQWEINPTKMACFHQGDVCLLSYVDDKLAGYTWAHTQGRPEMVPGLTLSIPGQYLYNYAGFTHPDFRGHGLQGFRHHALLDDPQWRDKKGLMGFVLRTNYSSRRGQDKSGYQRLGDVWLVGSKSRFWAHIAKGLRKMGVERLKDPTTRHTPTL